MTKSEKIFSDFVLNYFIFCSSRTHVRLGAWFWSAKADIFFSESLHSTLRFGRRKTIVSQTMCALAERLSQSEIVLPLRKTCYYSSLAEVGVFSTEINHALYNTHFLSKIPEHSWNVATKKSSLKHNSTKSLQSTVILQENEKHFQIILTFEKTVIKWKRFSIREG